MQTMIMWDKYENKYRDVVDVDELNIDVLKDIIKKYVEKKNIKEIKVYIEDLYNGKKGIEVFIK